ncbi:hypothetical protein QP028_05025 [Corynebacterium suedekumii]|nr:hypothetical protein QP028_05025 [Corynebacterium suedekumii]
MATKKPTTQKAPEVAMETRGPTRSTQVPAMAEDRPSMPMASEKIQPTATSRTSK